MVYLLLQRYFAHKNIKVSGTALGSIKYHPHFPSLASLSDTLDEWNIPNLAVKIGVEELSQIPYPAFVHLSNENEDLVLLQSYDNNQVTYQNSQGKTITEPLESFEAKWSGNALLIEPHQNSGEPGYSENRKKERWQSLENTLKIAALLVIIVLAGGLVANNLYQTGLLAALSVGLTASIFLLVNEFGKPSAFISQICHFNKQTDCNTILNSSASKLFGWLGWSEIGFLYFSGSSMALLLAVISNTAIQPILLIVSALTLPYTLFSIYYQAFVAKKWCVLCLVVQVALWGEFIVLLAELQGFSLTSINLASLFLVAGSFAFFVLVWFTIKPFLLKSKQTNSLESEVQVYRRHPELFETFFEQQRSIEKGEFTKEIIIGNPEAENTLLTVCNPYCKPCAIAHEELERLVTHFSEDLKLIIRFIIDKNPESEKTKVISHILSLPQEQLSEGVHAWFKIMDYEKWTSLYPVKSTEETPRLLEQHAQWSEYAQITHTPTIFLNGKELKFPYDYSKLKYHWRNYIEKRQGALV